MLKNVDPCFSNHQTTPFLKKTAQTDIGLTTATYATQYDSFTLNTMNTFTMDMPRKRQEMILKVKVLNVFGVIFRTCLFQREHDQLVQKDRLFSENM